MSVRNKTALSTARASILFFSFVHQLLNGLLLKAYFETITMNSLAWIFTATVIFTVATKADDTIKAKLTEDTGFSGPGSAFHLQVQNATGSWHFVNSDDFWLGFDVTCPVCDVICRQHGDFHAGGTYTIVEGRGEITFHADCQGDESRLSQCQITARSQRRGVSSEYHVGLQCFHLRSVDEVYSTWFILGTVLLGVLMLLVLGMCAWYYMRGGGKRKTIISSPGLESVPAEVLAPADVANQSDPENGLHSDEENYLEPVNEPRPDEERQYEAVYENQPDEMEQRTKK